MNSPVYLEINLTTKKVKRLKIEKEIFERYIGGKILAAKLLYDMTPAGIDPLSEEAVIIVNTGPGNGTGAPSSSRFNMSFKNVMTGGIASSNCGGNFGMMLKKAGYDGMILTGKAEVPSYIEILDGNVHVKNAEHLWGMDTEKVQEEFPPQYGKIVIGPAGENLVRYAGVLSGERVAGRCGAGAVFGSKNIKAVVAYGTKMPEIYNKEKFDRHVEKWVHFLQSHPMTGTSLPKYGSAGLVTKANATHALPTKNFQRGFYEEAEEISGETLADTRLIKNMGCVSCPIRCERRVKVYDKNVKGPEYETVGLFGANVESADLDLINEINYIADIMGMDTISLGGTIAFAMELKERGIADFGVEFGDVKKIPEIVKKIACREGIYSELANGSKWLAEKYGAEDAAIHAKGLELASYEPRKSVGMGLGYATSNRGGCHLNGGYLALLESVGVLSTDPLETKGKPELTVLMQNAMEAVSGSGFCLFTAYSMIPAVLFRLGPSHWITRLCGKVLIWARPILGIIWKFMPWILPFNSMYLLPHAEAIKQITGINMTTGRFMQLGERGYNVERLYNYREGLTANDDNLPDRLTKVPQADDPRSVVRLDKMLPRYYKVRGWKEDGSPSLFKLWQLKIHS